MISLRPLTAVALFASLASGAASAKSAGGKPKLGVIVVFDQVRALEIDRYAPFFGRGGFGGLDDVDRDGARYDAYYAYADTETGPGHATIATCANPDVHGIGANVWFENGEKRYVVDDKSAPVLGAPPGAAGRGPGALLVPTLADAMKADSFGKAHVVTVSLKDRAAILTGGKSADLAIWYDPDQGRFTTSKAYASDLPAWLADVGASLPKHTMETATWSPLPTPAGLEHLVPADDRAGEGGHDALSRAFPHDLKAVADEKARRRLYRITPQSIDDLFALALAAVDNVKLGKGDEADLLVVSVSTTDFVGHNYGPDSLEQLDTLRRADLSLRAFLRGLDERVGAHNYALAISADHGAPPLPLVAESEKWPHGIVLMDDVTEAARNAADKAVKGAGKRVLGFHPPEIALDEQGLDVDDRRKIDDAIAAAVEALPGIARVYDLTKPGDVDEFEPLMRASFYPGRESPLFVRQKPRVVFIDNKERTGTDHGSPYTYDRRVPAWFMGPGVRRGRYAQPIDPRDIAPTIAFLLGVAPPDACQGKPVSAVGDDPK